MQAVPKWIVIIIITKEGSGYRALPTTRYYLDRDRVNLRARKITTRMVFHQLVVSEAYFERARAASASRRWNYFSLAIDRYSSKF